MATIVEARPTAAYTTPALPKADSCILVIFGATGDLTRRKLIPALYDLACVGCMSPHFDIVGMGRKQLSDEEFRDNLDSARRLNEVLRSVFQEEDVYRIDHYLGKETVQNILVFRFGNLLFEPIWNRNYIDYVEITAAEILGVEQRAGFYEETGALRDMVANHMLQLLSLTAMEPPLAFDASSVRGNQVEVLSAIRPMTIEEVAERTVRGQYGPGQIDGKPVPGYHQEPGVAPAS